MANIATTKGDMINKTVKNIEETPCGLLFTFTDGTKYEIEYYSYPDGSFSEADVYKIA